MFSSRLHWDLQPSRLAEVIARKKQSGVRLLDLTESNPTAAGLVYPQEQILHAFAHAEALRYEPQAAGLMAAREATGQPADRTLLTASTSEAYSYVFKLLANAGDRVLVPRPSYPLFEFLAALEGVAVDTYPLYYDGRWSIDMHALRSAITDRTRAVVLVNPNNPTGSYVKRHELEELCGLGLPLVSDEVFSEYGFGSDPERVTTLGEVDSVLTFAMSGLSKLCGLPQMKLGWMTVNGPAAVRAEAFTRLEWIADTFLSVGTPVQHALPELLAAGAKVRAQIQARTRANLELVKPRVLHVEGGWYAILKVPRTRSEEEWVMELVENHNILVQPGYFYDFDSEAFLVLSLLTPEADFAEGWRTIQKLTA